MITHPATSSAVEIITAVKERIRSGRKDVQGVCFDYFDTIVNRVVSPEYTKRLAARNLVAVSGLAVSPRTIYEIRKELEVTLCKRNEAEGGDPEFSLYDLAAELYDIFAITSGKCGQPWTKSNFIQLFADIEVAVERQVQVPNTEILDFLWWLKANRISVYLISDFYIPLSHYLRMLKEHKLENVFSEYFISADYRLTKGSGKLYKKVLDQLSCDPQQLVMIGDNVHSDYAVPAHAGFMAYHLYTEEKRIFYSIWEDNNSSHGRRAMNLSTQLAKSLRENGKSYFPEMGMTLWLFTVKLFHQLNRDNVRDVFFCSKEGEFLKTLFEQFQETLYGRQVIQSHYLLVSRKATFICSLRPLREENFARLFDQYCDLSLEEFLLSLNFSPHQVEEICLEAGVEKEGRRVNMHEDRDFQALIHCKGFEDRYERHRLGQRSAFMSYLKSFGVQLETSGLAMVDVGWKGSIQNNIYHAFNQEVRVRGYYIGLLSPSGLAENNLKRGIVFSDYPHHSPYVHVYNNNRSLFEMLLGASHGSADGYFPAQNLRDVLEQRGSTTGCDFEDEMSCACAVTTLDLPEERKLFREAIAPLQQQYLKIFAEATRAYSRTEAGMPEEEWFARLHSRMVFRPRRAEVDFFSELYHLENFGLFEFTNFSSPKYVGLVERLKNFRQLLRTPAAYLETGIWPPIILKRMGLDFLQPIDGVKRYRKIFREQA